MELVDQRIAVWLISAVVAYFFFRWLFGARESPLSRHETEIEEILTSDKYKVKGRFEE